MYKSAAIMNLDVIMAFCAPSIGINLMVKIRCELGRGSNIGIQCEGLNT